MCGWFNMSETPRALADYFGLPAVQALPPRYNIASSRPVAVGLKADGHTRGLVPMVWGFVPHWSTGDKPAAFINARSETAAEKPTFRDAFRRHRCLILACGFYEWARTGGGKRPYHFRGRDGTHA